MDSPLIPDKQYLFAYCITDGALDDMSEEQRTSLLLTITEIKEEMLLRVQKKKFFSVRPNNSLFELTARTNRFK